MTSNQVVICFFSFFGIIVLIWMLVMGIVFIRATFKRIKNPEIDDCEYIVYVKKGYILRFCYGCCVAADTLLTVAGISATGVGAFIALLPDNTPVQVVLMLITSFVSVSLQNALNLKHGRIAYARAFRVLEFAVDEYRISYKLQSDKQKLYDANKEAQKIIEDISFEKNSFAKLLFHPKHHDLCVAVWTLANFMYKSQVIILQSCTTFHTCKFSTCFYFWCYYLNGVFYCGGEVQIRLVNIVYIRNTVHTSFAKFIVVAHYNVSTVVCVWMPSFKKTFQT